MHGVYRPFYSCRSVKYVLIAQRARPPGALVHDHGAHQGSALLYRFVVVVGVFFVASSSRTHALCFSVDPSGVWYVAWLFCSQD